MPEPKTGPFLCHNGREGYAYKDELGRYWMSLEGSKMHMVYSEAYVQRWLDTGKTDNGG